MFSREPAANLAGHYGGRGKGLSSKCVTLTSCCGQRYPGILRALPVRNSSVQHYKTFSKGRRNCQGALLQACGKSMKILLILHGCALQAVPEQARVRAWAAGAG